MHRTLKNCLLAGVSAAVLGLGVAGPAKAFDQVDWDWTATIDETVTKTVTITIDLTPVGLAMVEDLQVLIGDVNATATVNDINNYRPDGGTDGGVLELQWRYALGGGVYVDPGNSPEVVAGAPGANCTANSFGGPVLGTCVDETDGNGYNGTVYALVDLEDLLGETLDAVTQLPQVVNAATAVGNNVDITADVALQLHEGQFVVGGPCGECDAADEDGVFDNAGLAALAAYFGVNTNLILTGLLGYEALNGNISPASITATATVFDILNATVNNAATAVANNKSITQLYAPDTNGLLIGDVTQFAFADVAATATVYGVDINNYSNLGGTFRPIVNNVATAVGNNLSINVTVAP